MVFKRVPTIVTALLAVVAFALSATGQAGPSGPVRGPGQEEAGYIGTPMCMTCHHTYATLWASVEHSELMSEPPVPANQRGCEGCHGPGELHVGPDRKAIVSWDDLEVKQRATICLPCHEDLGIEEGLWFDRDHSELLGCTECHEVHRPVDRPQLLKTEAGKDCSPCHDDLEERAAEGLHHPLYEGSLACSMCHQFHGNEQRNLLNRSQSALCIGCHGRNVPQPENHKRTDFRLGHGDDARGKEDTCYTCHDEQEFCNQCHAIDYPHAEEYIMEHGTEAAEFSSTCLNCHQPDYCGMCHDPLPEPFDAIAAQMAADAEEDDL